MFLPPCSCDIPAVPGRPSKHCWDPRGGFEEQDGQRPPADSLERLSHPPAPAGLGLQHFLSILRDKRFDGWESVLWTLFGGIWTRCLFEVMDSRLSHTCQGKAFPGAVWAFRARPTPAKGAAALSVWGGRGWWAAGKSFGKVGCLHLAGVRGKWPHTFLPFVNPQRLSSAKQFHLVLLSKNKK